MSIESVLSARVPVETPHPRSGIESVVRPVFTRAHAGSPDPLAQPSRMTRRDAADARRLPSSAPVRTGANPGRPEMRELHLARRQSAGCIEALHRIYNGIEPHSPARAMNGGKPVGLDVPEDLAKGFRDFLTHPDQGPAYFKADSPMARPNASGTFTAGKSVAYSIQEMPGSPDGRRRVVVTVGGLTAGMAVDPSTPGRAWANSERTGPQLACIGRLSAGLPNEMKAFGELLGDWVSQVKRQDGSLDITVQGHSMGAVAAAEAFCTSIRQGQPVKANFYNPAPLSMPGDPEGFARAVARLGGEGNLRKLAATFKSERDPVDIVQRVPGGRHFLRLAGADWNPASFSTVYECGDDGLSGLQQHNHPARNIAAGLQMPVDAPVNARHRDVPVSMGSIYAAQIAGANRLL